MSDREMLGLAAESIGLPECGWMGESFMYVKDNTWAFWNPLEDDGDAFRLAAACGLAVIPYPIHAQPKHSVIAKRYGESLPLYRGEVKSVEVIEPYGYEGDPAAATRRAITRAAAAIGAEIQRNRGAA